MLDKQVAPLWKGKGIPSWSQAQLSKWCSGWRVAPLDPWLVSLSSAQHVPLNVAALISEHDGGEFPINSAWKELRSEKGKRRRKREGGRGKTKSGEGGGKENAKMLKCLF